MNTWLIIALSLWGSIVLFEAFLSSHKTAKKIATAIAIWLSIGSILTWPITLISCVWLKVILLVILWLIVVISVVSIVTSIPYEGQTSYSGDVGCGEYYGDKSIPDDMRPWDWGGPAV